MNDTIRKKAMLIWSHAMGRTPLAFRATERRRGSRVLCAAFFSALGLAALVSSALDAGSIFMKNGYIIQGRVVDRDDLAVVLGWPNGKVSIAKRFIDSVVLEPAEEQSLGELAAARQAEAGATASEDMAVNSASSQPLDLPSSLEDFMQTYKITPRSTAAKGANGEGEAQPSDEVAAVRTIEPPDVALTVEPGSAQGNPASGSPSGEELQPEVKPIGPSAELLGEAIRDASRLISLRPPKGWNTSDEKGVLQMTGEADASGFRPRLNVVLLPKGPLASEDYVAIIKEEQTRSLKDYELLQEGWREVGLEKSFELVASGAYAGRKAVLRQCLVVKAEHLWLLSGFTADRDPRGAFGRVEEALKTVEFTAE